MATTLVRPHKGNNILDSEKQERDNLTKLMSWWEMLDKYGYRIVNLLRFFDFWKGFYGKSTSLDRYDLDNLLKHVESTLKLCEEVGLASARVRAQYLIQALCSPPPIIAGEQGWHGDQYVYHLQELERHLETDLDEIYFEGVPKDRLKYYGATFGPDVERAFPTVTYDMKEANTCYALGRSTACVFHCMRTAELALRALCRDRRVSYRGRDIDQKEWGQLLRNLDAENDKLVRSPSGQWKSPQVRDAQIAFYSEAVSIFRGLNERWRKPVSHSRSRYDDSEAASIRQRTQELMIWLSGRISERRKTPLIWVKA